MSDVYQRQDGKVVIEGSVVVKETERAVRVSSYALDEEIWLPKACVDDDSDVWEEGQEAGDLVISENMAKSKGLI